jgi:hypothetical protein
LRPVAPRPQVAAQLRPNESRNRQTAKLPATREVPQPAAQFTDSILWTIPWFHHVVLMEKVKDKATRFWYMQQVLANGWSRNVLLLMIKSEAHSRQRKALTNFDRLLPVPQSDQPCSEKRIDVTSATGIATASRIFPL